MKALIFSGITCALLGCASTDASFNSKQQLQLGQLINKVEQQQIRTQEPAADPRVLFSVEFNAQTTSVLAEPTLMPALLSSSSQQLVVVVSIAPSPTPFDDLSRALKLSQQLAQFLQDQRYQVTRRLDANANVNRIQLQLP